MLVNPIYYAKTTTKTLVLEDIVSAKYIIMYDHHVQS